MRIKTIAIFAIAYAFALGAGLVLMLAAIRAAGIDAAQHKTLNNIGFLLNMAVFAAAIVFALSRRAHALLGGAPGPLAFRDLLSRNRHMLAAGIAVLAILVDLAAYLAASSWFAGEMRVPSLARLAAMTAVYGMLAFMVISDIARRRHGGR